MALTMTRTRTQTTLTKLAEMVANVHGELAFLDGLLKAAGAPEPTPEPTPEVHARLEVRRLKLLGDRDVLYAAIRQFDASIDPEGIGDSEGWRKWYGRGLGEVGLVQRYLARASQLGGHP